MTLTKRQRRKLRKRRHVAQVIPFVPFAPVEARRQMPDIDHAAAERLSWFVVYCGYRAEFVAEDELRRLCPDAWCPALIHTVTHARKRTEKRSPLFPRYLFVGLSKTDHGPGGLEFPFDTVKGAEGVEGMLGYRGAPFQIPYGEPDPEFLRFDREHKGPPLSLRTLRELEASGAFDEAPASEGDSLLVRSGPLKGFCVDFVRWEPNARLSVMVQMMGVRKEVVLRESQIEWSERAA